MYVCILLALVPVLRPGFQAESLAFPLSFSENCCKREAMVVLEIFLLYFGADVSDDSQGCSGVRACARILLACIYYGERKHSEPRRISRQELMKSALRSKYANTAENVE